METISRVPKIEGPKFESLLNSTMQVRPFFPNTIIIARILRGYKFLRFSLIKHVPRTFISTNLRLHDDHYSLYIILQDLLMVVYLAELTKTQMTLGERLSQFKSPN